MAPELLTREKYKKPADIYSLGVTMFECFMWKEAYKGKIFKFPWGIAEFVVSGKRLKNEGNIPANLFEIIEEAWLQDQKLRCKIQNVVEWLQEVFEEEKMSPDNINEKLSDETQL
ncbi:tyrosine kinase, putative, partial [Entamoeba invadens IP1]